MNLDTWLGIQPPTRIHYCRKGGFAYFTDIRPADLTFVHSHHVRISTGLIYTVDTFIHDMELATPSDDLIMPPCCKNISILKSLLQKAVRRMNTTVAMKAAANMIENDVTE